MAKTLASPNSEILEAALLGLESQREKLDAKIAEVRSLLGRKVRKPAAKSSVTALATVAMPVNGVKRVLSPDARKRIAAAQKKRWAAFRKKQK